MIKIIIKFWQAVYLFTFFELFLNTRKFFEKMTFSRGSLLFQYFLNRVLVRGIIEGKNSLEKFSYLKKQFCGSL